MSTERPPPGQAQTGARVLTVNVGSSSIKFAFFNGSGSPERVLSGQLDRIGTTGTTLSFKRGKGGASSRAFASEDAAAATRRLLDWFQELAEFGSVAVVAHRLVHGGPKYREPQRVTPELLADLRRISPMDPDHLPL